MKVFGLVVAICFSNMFAIHSQNLKWAVSFGDTLDDEVNSIVIDQHGNIICTGMFGGTVDFDPGVASSLLTYEFGYGGYISKFDSTGNFIWGKQIVESNQAFTEPLVAT